MNVDGQTALVKTVVCVITAGDKTKSARVSVMAQADQHVLGKYDGVRLVSP